MHYIKFKNSKLIYSILGAAVVIFTEKKNDTENHRRKLTALSLS